MTHDCKACRRTWPPASHRIGDCGLTTAYLFEDQFFPGWTVLVLKTHATELFQLTPTDQGRLMMEVSAVAQVLAQHYRAIKMNYELLGNQLPHIHWHLIPRRAEDPAPLEPVWRVTHAAVSLGPQQLTTELAALREGLTKSLPEFSIGS